MEKHSPEKIVEILHSIKELSVKDGELDVLFVDSDSVMSITEFVPNTFTRKLLELIDGHLTCNSVYETSESIIDTLNSISGFKIVNYNLTAHFHEYASQSPRAFNLHSFTRELLELIEEHFTS